MRTSSIFVIVTALLSFSVGLYAQGVDDALLNSQTYYEGTARSMAMGNATGALGGDITSMCINPAGLGIYRSSEFTFSTGLQYNFVVSDYYGTRENDGRFRMSIPNVGLVMGGDVSNYKPLRYFQIGVGLTRTNDFNYRSTASGLNPSSSMVDNYLQTINSLSNLNDLLDPCVNPGEFFSTNYPYDLSPAWETYLIDRFYDTSNNSYFFGSDVPAGNVWQNNSVVSKGRAEEWTFAAAGNFYDKIFVGASLGITHLKLIRTRKYKETPNATDNSFNNWTHQEDLEDSANGANIKLGVIYYPAQWIRLGAAWHSWTSYTFDETWSTETSATLKKLSPTLNQSYDFQTPQTLIGSCAFFIGQHGLITADMEYMDYGSGQFSNDEDSFIDVNNSISATLKPTFNMRLGTEWRVWQYFLRGGAAYYGSPYGFGNTYGSVKKFSLGLGYATSENTFWDFAYELTEATSAYAPYQCFVDGQNIVNDVTQRQWRNKFVITMKIKM